MASIRLSLDFRKITPHSLLFHITWKSRYLLEMNKKEAKSMRIVLTLSSWGLISSSPHVKHFTPSGSTRSSSFCFWIENTKLYFLDQSFYISGNILKTLMPWTVYKSFILILIGLNSLSKNANGTEIVLVPLEPLLFQNQPSPNLEPRLSTHFAWSFLALDARIELVVKI